MIKKPILQFFCNFEFQFFSSNCLIFQFLTSDSNSTGRNPPRAHLRMSENLHFEISAPLRRVGKTSDKTLIDKLVEITK